MKENTIVLARFGVLTVAFMISSLG